MTSAVRAKEQGHPPVSPLQIAGVRLELALTALERTVKAMPKPDAEKEGRLTKENALLKAQNAAVSAQRTRLEERCAKLELATVAVVEKVEQMALNLTAQGAA